MHDSYAYPPRGLSRSEAARYVGADAIAFDVMVSSGRMPPALGIGDREVWDRLELDAAFTCLRHVGQARPAIRPKDAPVERPEGRQPQGIEWLKEFGLVPEEDFAAMLGVGLKTLKNRPRDQLPEFVKIGHRRLFRAESVRAYLDRQTVNGSTARTAKRSAS